MGKSRSNSQNWKNRIVNYGARPAQEFNFHPLNWRQHSPAQRNAIDALLEEIGWVTGVIENITTGNLIDGHLRVEEALAKNADEIIPFIQVELSEEEELKMLAVLDPVGAMAGTDMERLRLLTEGLTFQSEALSEIISQRLPSDVNLEDFFEQKQTELPEREFIIELAYKREDYERVKAALGAIDSLPAAAVKKLLEL